MAQFSLTWDAYKQNICSGLSALQQTGEFVDMTLAADGHHVKVHQMVMSLVSPYIKELITSAQCPHPVIFLNKVSYVTLCSILEYVYTGEVHIAKENIQDLMDAAQQLHIKGLEEMKLELSMNPSTSQAITIHKKGQRQSQSQTQASSFRATAATTRVGSQHDLPEAQRDTTMELYSFDNDNFTADSPMQATTDDDTPPLEHTANGAEAISPVTTSRTCTFNTNVRDAQIQFTVSNQGNLQLILNRCVYYLKYTSKRGPGPSGHRLWRCVDNSRKSKCPATVFTKDNLVVKRCGAHNHPFHDNLILKKVQRVGVFAAVEQAVVHGESMKKQNMQAETTADSKKAGSSQDTD